MHRTSSTILAILLIATLLGFAQDDSDRRETVVPKGDPGSGRELFETKQCYQCHTVAGQRFPEVDSPDTNLIRLAGDNNPNWDRDLYAAQIMDPQHLISPDHQKAMIIVGNRLDAENSPMPDFNRSLTVGEMIDLATFLEEQTELSQSR